MSTENGKVCCNCRHRIRVDNWKYECQKDGHYIGYIECMEGWCKHWASDEKKWKEEK